MDTFNTSSRCRTLNRGGNNIVHTFHKGYTLVELMTTLAVFGLMFGIGGPAVHSVISANRLTANVNRLSRSLALTRSEAIARNRHVVICKSADQRTCTTSGTWQQGWIIFEDREINRKREPEELLIHSEGPLQNSINVDYAAFRSRHFIAYRPSGITLTNGTFTFCIEDDPKTAKALILSKTGRVRISKTKSSGKPLTCPH